MDSPVTLDPALRDSQWREFDEMVEALDMPFYYFAENHDNEQNQKPSRLYWKPKWGASEDYEGSGVFEL